jgi:hypothetical protein
LSDYSETENRMTQQAPEPTPQTPPTPAPTSPPAAEKQPPWGSAENFSPEKAWELIQNLRNEKSGDPTLKTELEQLRAQQTQQRDALAAALGVKPEETSDTEKLATQIAGLQGQILASEKRALAVEFKVPEAMLTAPDAEALRAQAASLAEFAQAAHYAAATASPPAPPPTFQPNPGQGQGGGALTPDAQAAAEYEKYYPSTK